MEEEEEVRIVEEEEEVVGMVEEEEVGIVEEEEVGMVEQEEEVGMVRVHLGALTHTHTHMVIKKKYSPSKIHHLGDLTRGLG